MNSLYLKSAFLFNRITVRFGDFQLLVRNDRSGKFGATYPVATMFQQAMALSNEGISAERNQNAEYLYCLCDHVARSSYSGSAQYFPNPKFAKGKRFRKGHEDSVFYRQNPDFSEHTKAICRVISLYSHSQKLSLHNAFRKSKVFFTGKFVAGEGLPESFSPRTHNKLHEKLFQYNNGMSKHSIRKLCNSDLEYNFFVLAPLVPIVASDQDQIKKPYFLILVDLLLLKYSEGITSNPRGHEPDFIFKPGAVFSPDLLLEFTSVILRYVIDAQLFPKSHRTPIKYDEPLGKLTTQLKNLVGDCPHNVERNNLREGVFISSKCAKRLFLRICTQVPHFKKMWDDFRAGLCLIPLADFTQYMYGNNLNKILFEPPLKIEIGNFLPGVLEYLQKMTPEDLRRVRYLEVVTLGRKGAKKTRYKVRIFFNPNPSLSIVLLFINYRKKKLEKNSG